MILVLYISRYIGCQRMEHGLQSLIALANTMSYFGCFLVVAKHDTIQVHLSI